MSNSDGQVLDDWRLGGFDTSNARTMTWLTDVLAKHSRPDPVLVYRMAGLCARASQSSGTAVILRALQASLVTDGPEQLVRLLEDGDGKYVNLWRVKRMRRLKRKIDKDVRKRFYEDAREEPDAGTLRLLGDIVQKLLFSENIVMYYDVAALRVAGAAASVFAHEGSLCDDAKCRQKLYATLVNWAVTTAKACDANFVAQAKTIIATVYEAAPPPGDLQVRLTRAEAEFAKLHRNVEVALKKEGHGARPELDRAMAALKTVAADALTLSRDARAASDYSKAEAGMDVFASVSELWNNKPHAEATKLIRGWLPGAKSRAQESVQLATAASRAGDLAASQAGHVAKLDKRASDRARQLVTEEKEAAQAHANAQAAAKKKQDQANTKQWLRQIYKRMQKSNGR